MLPLVALTIQHLTSWMTTGICGHVLNVVAPHARGFFVGGAGGKLHVFEQNKRGAAAGGNDEYALTLVVRIFGVDLVELRPATEPDYRWVSWGG